MPFISLLPPLADERSIRFGSVDCVRFEEGGGMPDEISWEDFEKVDVRVGRVVEAGPLPRATSPP
jgi:hypothetical protein